MCAAVFGLLSSVLPLVSSASSSDYSGWRKADGTPQAVILSYYDGPDTRGFAWQTSTSVSSGSVWLLSGDFGSANDADFATNQVATAASTKQSTECYTHKAHVAGLQPGRYSYRLGTTSHFAYGKFEVRDGTKPFVAVNITDIQLKSADKLSNWKNVVKGANAVLDGGSNADTIISCGDFIDQTNPSGYNRYVCWGVTADQARDEFADVAWTMAGGNHDNDTTKTYCKDCCAENYDSSAASNGGGCHSYNYGKVHVATIPYASSLSSGVETWLKNDLAAAQDAQWRILVMHFGPYTTGDHGFSANTTYIQKVSGLCATYKVDLVLQGHDHTYSKTLPYRWTGNGYTKTEDDSDAVNLKPATVVIGGETYYDKPEGTVYVSAGCAGDRVGEQNQSPYYYAVRGKSTKSYDNREYKIVTDTVNVKSTYANVGDDGSADVGKPMFAVLTVDDSTLKYDWYVAASSSPELFDTLRISKAPPEPPHDEDEAITVAFGAAATVTTIANQTTWSYAVTDGEEFVRVACVTNDDNTATFTFTGVEPGTATVVIYQEDGVTPLKTVTVTVLPPDPMTTPIETKFNGAVVTTVGAVINATDPSGDLILVYTNVAAQGSLTLPQPESARILVVGGGAGGVAAKAGKDSTSARRYTGNGGNSGAAEELERALPTGQYTIEVGAGGPSVTPAIESGTSYYDFTGGNPGKASSIAGGTGFATIAKSGGTAWETKNDDGSGVKASSKTASKASDGSGVSLKSDITGTETTYAVGGAGGSSSDAVRGADAAPATGNGGGGSAGGTAGADSGAGGSGIVVVRLVRAIEPVDAGGGEYVFAQAAEENLVIVTNASAFRVADGFVLTAQELAKYRLNGVSGETLAAAFGGGSYAAGAFTLDADGTPTLQGGTLGFASSGTVSGVILDGTLTVDVASGATVTFADILRADAEQIVVMGEGQVRFADDVIPETGAPDSSGKLYLCVGDQVTLRFGRSSTSTFGSTSWTASAGSDDIVLDATSVSVSGSNPANFTVTAQKENADGVALTVTRSTQTFKYTISVLPARRLLVGEVSKHWCNTAISGQTWALSAVSAGLEASVEKTEGSSGLVALTGKALGANQTVTATAGYATAGSTGALLGVSYVLTTAVYEPVTPKETVLDGKTVTTVGATVDATTAPGELILIYTDTENPGSLEIPTNATARILVVGGGGGGASGKKGTNKYYGDGGSGGQGVDKSISLPAGSYAITVGAGGAGIMGGTSDPEIKQGEDGRPSSFAAAAGVSDFEPITGAGGAKGGSTSHKNANSSAGSAGFGTSDITGTSVTYGAAGAGVTYSSNDAEGRKPGADGASGSGAGGGGAGYNSLSGAGGSGIVVVRITGFGETPPGPIDPPVEPLVTNKISYVGLEGAANPNPTEFTTNDLPITLSAPGARDGYTFAGWTPNGGVIPAGTTEDVTFTATWTKVEPPPTEKDEDVTIGVLAAGASTNFTTVAKATNWTVDLSANANFAVSASRNADGTATVTVSGTYGDTTAYTATVKGDGVTVLKVTVSKVGPKEQNVTLAAGGTFTDTCSFRDTRTWTVNAAPSGYVTPQMNPASNASSSTLTITAGQTSGEATVTVQRNSSKGNVDMYVYHVTVTAAAAGPAKFCVTPYLQRPASDAMSILFFTDSACTATVTCAFANGSGPTQTLTSVGVWAEALTNNVAVGESSVWSNRLYRHRVRFEGLKPNRLYDYTVTLEGGAAYANVFRTAPDRNTPIRFVSYADCETEKDPWNNYVKNLARMKERDPDFVTISGDMAARGGIQSHWDGFWQANAGAKGDIAGSVPLLTVIGNHDLFDNGRPGDNENVYMYDQQGEPSTERFLSYFEVESNGVDFASAPAPHTETRDLSQLFHRVDYGPVTLIFLDTNNGQDGDTDADHDKDTNYLKSDSSLARDHLVGGLDRRKGCRHPDFNVGSPQYVWLTNNLADAQAKSRFTFVFNHHCPYSRGSHNKSWTTGEDGSALALRFLTETFVRYGVDGWYCGHDELLEHSVTTGEEILPNGTTRPHTLSIYDLGCSGDEPRSSSGGDNPLEYWRSSGNYEGSGSYGFLETDVTMDEQGRWTCTVTPYSGASKKLMGDQFVYVESLTQEAGKNDLVYAQNGKIDGVSTAAPSTWGWTAWTRPEEGCWDDDVPVTLGSVSVAPATYAGVKLMPNLTVRTTDGQLIPSDRYEVTGWSAEPKDAGTYTATVSGKGNVSGQADFTFTIAAASVTVTADDKEKTPGAADPELTATVTGTFNGETVKYQLSRASGEAEGEYAITPTGDAEQGNYQVTFVPGKLKIAKESIPLPTTTEATVNLSNVPMGTVETVTTTSRADTWECTIQNASADERSICMEVNVVRNEDGTATAAINCKYANGTTFTVDIVAVNYAGARKTVKTVKVSKIVAAPAVEVPLTVGQTFTAACAFGAAEPWKLTTSGSAVDAQLSSGTSESVEQTTLTVTGKSAGTQTVTVVRVNGQYSTDMYVYTFVVKAELTPFDRLCEAAMSGVATNLAADMEFPADGVLTVPAGAEFVLDLKGHAITAHADGAIVNHGKLTVLDSTKSGPLAAHLTYSAAELGKGRTLVKSDGELVIAGVFVDGGVVDGADSEFRSGNTAIAATAGRVTVKNGAHVGGQTAIEATGDVAVEIRDAHVAGWRGAVAGSGAAAGAAAVRGDATLFVSNATMEAEGALIRTVAASATGPSATGPSSVTIVDSTLVTSHTAAPFDLASGVTVTVERSAYIDRWASWLPVTTALANTGANLTVGAGCLLAVANEGVIGFLAEGVTAGAVGTRVWRTKGKDDAEPLPPLTPEEEAKIAEVLKSSPDAALKANITTIEAYTDYKTWVDEKVEAGGIASEAAAKGAEGSFFSFATDQDHLVDPATVTEEKVKIEEMKVNGGGVTLTVGIQDLPVGENAQAQYLEKVFGVTGTAALDEDFAAEKVTYRQDLKRNSDGTVSYTAEPKVEAGEEKPETFFFKATVTK